MATLLIRLIGGVIHKMLRMTEKLNLLTNTASSEEHNPSKRGDFVTSMCGFIQKVLNTQLGSVSINPLMGVAAKDISPGNIEDDVGELLASIERLLLNIDPRITGIKTQYREEPEVTVILGFQMTIDACSKPAFRLDGKLLSDYTFEVNPL